MSTKQIQQYYKIKKAVELLSTNNRRVEFAIKLALKKCDNASFRKWATKWLSDEKPDYEHSVSVICRCHHVGAALAIDASLFLNNSSRESQESLHSKVRRSIYNTLNGM